MPVAPADGRRGCSAPSRFGSSNEAGRLATMMLVSPRQVILLAGVASGAPATVTAGYTPAGSPAAGPTATAARLHESEIVAQPPSGAMLDVKQFGAVGDGKADDAPALQQALDASQQQHRALFVSAGTYLINTTLTVRNPREPKYTSWGSVRLLGEGNLGGQTVITPGRILPALLAFSSAGPQGASWACDNCPSLGNTTNGHSVEGIMFDGNRMANFSVFGPAVCRSEFLRCSFNGARIAGLYIGWGWINTVSGCWASGNDLAGLYFDWAVNSIDVINTNLEGNHGIGIIANDGYAMRVEGCCFESMGGPAMVANRMSALTYRANYHEANNRNSRVLWKSIAESAPVPVCSDLILNGAGGDFRLKDFLANATLNGTTSLPFYAIPALSLGAAGAGEGCGAVTVEGNFYNPGQSKCLSPMYSGVYVGSGFGVSAKANICTNCARGDPERTCAALGGNITQDETLFESKLNVGWEGTLRLAVASQSRHLQFTER